MKKINESYGDWILRVLSSCDNRDHFTSFGQWLDRIENRPYTPSIVNCMAEIVRSKPLKWRFDE